MEQADPRSRRAILNLLKQRGPTDSKTLAAALKLTPMAVRLHLYALRDQKIVDHIEESRAIGRPAKLWRLTSQAHRIFPDAHAELSVSLIESMGEAFGSDGLNQLLQIRKRKQVDAYAEMLLPLIALPDRLQTLAEIRTREGYMAEVQPLGDGAYLFIENHCPICAAATACLGFCTIELDIFREVLGPGLQIERDEHILAGARRCAYRVAPAVNLQPLAD